MFICLYVLPIIKNPLKEEKSRFFDLFCSEKTNDHTKYFEGAIQEQENDLKMEIIEITFDHFTITTDKSKMDTAAIHDFLSNHSGWSDNIPLEKVKLSIENSLNFGLFDHHKQVGFARIISDYSTIAYLGDIYVLENYRGQGLSKKLMDTVMSHPNLQGLRRWILLTSTADWLYSKYSFAKLPKPEIYMELYNADVYKE